VAEWQNVVFGQFLTLVLGEKTMKKYQLDLGDENAYSQYNPALDATLFHNFATAAYRFGHTLLNGLIKLVRNLEEVGSYLVRDNYFNSSQVSLENKRLLIHVALLLSFPVKEYM
jgi:peroxidase